MFLDSNMYYINEVIKETLMTYQNVWMVATVYVFLLLASITDIRTLKITNKLNLTFLVVRFLLVPVIGLSIDSFIGAMIGFFILIIPAVLLMHKMGGDIKCFTVLGLYLGSGTMITFIVLLSILGAICMGANYLIKGQKKNMAFAPFFLVIHLGLTIASMVAL